jgi:hypothetical protein
VDEMSNKRRPADGRRTTVTVYPGSASATVDGVAERELQGDGAPRWLRDWVMGEGFPDWMPPAMRKRGSAELGTIVRRLGMDSQDLHELQQLIARDVADARARGASWQLVGLALGISAEGARSRYGRPAGKAATGGEVASG